MRGNSNLGAFQFPYGFIEMDSLGSGNLKGYFQHLRIKSSRRPEAEKRTENPVCIESEKCGGAAKKYRKGKRFSFLKINLKRSA